MIQKSGKFLRMLFILSLLLMTPAGLIQAVEESDNAPAYMYQSNDDLVSTYFTSSTNVSTLDPAIAEDALSINWIENLFLGITNNNPLNNFDIQPELASSWTILNDGRTWQFQIRNDVPWVRYHPDTGKVEKLRNIVAEDIVWSIKRACDPRLGGRYGTIIAGVIAGCDKVNRTPADQVTDELVFGDTVQVEAPDDETLIINLKYAAPFFFSMSTIWTIRPVYREAIEEYGDNWTDPGNIVTSGPFMLEELVPDVRRVAVVNPYIPADIRGPGNLERVEVQIVSDVNTTYQLYRAGQVDTSGVPAAELENVRNDPVLSEQIVPSLDSAVSYIAFDHAKPPFDDVHLRRAFNAIIDRDAYIQRVNNGIGDPMVHFTPPGMLGAPPSMAEPGVGFDVEYARAELAKSNYPNCEGLPPINAASGVGGGDTFEFLKSAAEEYLGCNPGLFTIEELEFSVLLEITAFDEPVENRPHMWSIAWGPDYPDANNWVNDVISCQKTNFLRPCTELDDLMEAAARESDPERRNLLYYQVEEGLFGSEGEIPFIPLALSAGFSLVQPWYDGPFNTDGLLGGAHWDWRTVDVEMQNEARN